MHCVATVGNSLHLDPMNSHSMHSQAQLPLTDDSLPSLIHANNTLAAVPRETSSASLHH